MVDEDADAAKWNRVIACSKTAHMILHPAESEHNLPRSPSHVEALPSCESKQGSAYLAALVCTWPHPHALPKVHALLELE